MPQKTDLNVAPYYDDFDPNDKFNRVLFRPGFAVQARELTTLQSILQNQVERNGRHFFKEGSMVVPGQISTTNKYYAVKLQATFSGNAISTYLSSYVGKIITGSISGITARVIAVEAATSTDAPTLYVNYLTTATSTANATASTGASTAGTTLRFVDGESLAADAVINSESAGTNTSTLLTSNATAIGSSAKIEEGIYFVRGQFVKVEEQRIILDKYTNTPSYRVGLTVGEILETPENDTTLLDNATGTSNVNAKGAHRLKTTLTLSKLPLGSSADENFIELLNLSNGRINSIVDKTEYSIFQDNLARRTFDESGNYTVRPFDIEFKETLDDGINNGVYSSGSTTDSGNTASEDFMTVQISPGKAYVRGYEVETLTPTFIDIKKPRNTENFNEAITGIEVGNFVRVEKCFGSPDLTPFISGEVEEPYREVELHGTKTSTRGQTMSDLIGVARIRAFEHASGNDGAGVNALASASVTTSQFNLYLFDIRMFTKLSLSGTPASSNAGGAVNGAKITGATSGATAFLKSSSSSNLEVINVVGNFVVGEKLISTSSNVADQIIENSSNTDLTINGITLRNFTDVKAFFMDSPNTTADFTADAVLDQSTTLNGSVTMNGSNANVTGFGTSFVTDLKVGDFVTVSGAGAGGADLTAKVNTITHNTTIVLASNSATAVTTVPIIRKRNQLRDQQKNLLLRKLRKKRIKTLKTDINNGVSDSTITFRRQFVTTTTSGGVINLTASANESFSAKSNTDYIITKLTAGSAIGGSSTNAPAGDTINLSATTTTGFAGVGTNSLSITNAAVFGNGAKVKVTATLTRTSTNEKTKTKQAAHIVLVDANSSAGAEVGTASQHKEISIGRADAFKLHGVFDSEDTGTNPVLPQFTLTGISGTFTKGEKITGGTSGATATIVNPTSPITFITTNNKDFTANETITGASSAATATLGTFTAGSKNITDRFTLDTGQRDNFYDIARIIRKAGKPVPVGKLLVVVDYFEHGTGDFFTVDSYSAVDYKEIPVYTATRVDPEVREPSGEFDLRDSIDFRPRVKDATTSTTSIQGQTAHQVNGFSFDFENRKFTGTGSSTINIPKDNSNFQYDFDFFLGRKDSIFLVENGDFKIINGADAENPERPKPIEKAMLLAEIQSPAYVLDINDVVFEKSNNRRYTMSDIGDLERRINTVEYYTVLNLLEKEAQSFQIQDENGLDRFKSGFVVDNFTGHSVGDVKNEDYRNSIDYEEKELRPKYFMKGIDLIEQNTTDTERTTDGYQKTGDLVTLPYTDVVTVQQPYATRVENLNPVLTFSWAGVCVLDPSGDEWFEVNRLPDLIINQEGNFDQLVAQVGNAMGTIWNAWQTQWSGSSTRRNQVNTGQQLIERTVTTNTRRQRRQGVNTRVVAQIDRESLGDKIRSTALIPFMRAKNITFTITGMKPNTRIYPFFDKQNITSFVTITSSSGVTGHQQNVKGATSTFTDGNGRIDGLFELPDPNVTGNPKFRTGERLFRVTSSATNETVPEPETFAQALFSSTGTLRTVQEEIIATRNGRIEVTNVTQNRTLSNVTAVRQRVLADFSSDDGGDSNSGDGSNDPLAQTFTLETIGGEFITKMDVFFQRKDAIIPVLAQLREVVNGFPTIKQLPFAGKHLNPYMDGTVSINANSTTVTGTNTDFLTGKHNLRVGDTITISEAGTQTSGIPNQEGYDANALVTTVTAITSDTELTVATPARSDQNSSGKKISNVNLSADASVPTTFRFDSPVYIKDGVETSMVLFTQCESYFAWISRMGEIDIGGTRMVSKQPHLGVLFKSQNNTTWNSYQYEDLKFTLYRAEFNTGSTGTLTLTNGIVPSKTLGVDPVRTISGTNTVQITHSDHHMYSSNNNVTISGAKSGISTTLNGAITNAAGINLTLTSATGFEASNDSSRCYVKIDNEILFGTLSSNNINNLTRAQDGTSAAAHANGATVELYQINKIPLTEINTTHTSLSNIGIDNYVVTTTTNANASSNQGGNAVVATENAQMDGGDVFLPTVEFPDTLVTSKIRTTTGTSPSGSETSFALQATTNAKTIALNENFFFDNPKIIASPINETNEISGSKSFFLDVSLSSTIPSLSPIIDLDRKSVIAFTNRLNNIDSSSDVFPTTDFVGAEASSGDSNEAIYVTRKVSLDNPASGLKVIVDINRLASADVQLMFKILRSDDASDFDELGYNFFNTAGESDNTVTPSSTLDDFKEYEFTANDLDEFIAFSIKIRMQGTNSSEPPRLKDLRAIALAT